MKNKKSLGQHWLKNRTILDAIARIAAGLPEPALAGSLARSDAAAREDGPAKEQAGVANPQLCLEIGPGLGTLTSSLLRRFQKVIAVEFDADLAAKLPKSFPGKNLEVVNEDILQFDFSQITEPYVVAGNIPYYITSPIVLRLLEIIPQPAKIVLLVQKEVAERATPVKNHENLLSLTIQNRAHATRELIVGREEFTPAPKVDSQVLVLTPHAPLYPEAVLSLAKLGFSSPRKKLAGNLSRGLEMPREKIIAALATLGLSPDTRPAELSLEDWHALYHQLVI